MDRTELQAFCELLMVLDRYPLGVHNERIVKGYINQVAKSFGYGDWVDAYHNLDADIDEECFDQGQFGVGA